MRTITILVCAATLGCSPGTNRAVEAVAEAEGPPIKASPKDAPPEDLRAAKKGDDWPGFLGPTHDSVSREKGILTKWPATGPKIVWYRPLESGYSMPSISRGRLFLFDRMRNRCRLRCWNATNAEPIWSFEYLTDYVDKYNYKGGPRCCPLVDGNRVYAFGPEGMLHCVRVTDGKLIWKADTAGDFGVVQNFFGVGSTPVVEGDLLLVQVGGSPKGSDTVAFEDLKGNGSGLVAFDKYTGKVKWKVSDELASYSSPVVHAFGKKRLALVFARGGLLAVDVATGKQAFHYPWRADMLESVNASNPLVVGSRVLITECYQVGSSLLEVTPDGYKKVWSDAERPGRSKSLMCHWMTPIHVSGYVYGSSGRHTTDAELRCVELATGKVMWRERNLSRSSLLLVDGHFVCLSEDGTLRLLRVNPKAYDEVARVELRRPDKNGKADPDGEMLLTYPCWSAPILSKGLLYVRGDRWLVCLELIPQAKK